MQTDIPEPQAEVIITAIARTKTPVPDISQLASKSDVAAVKNDVTVLKSELKGDIALLEANLKGEIALVEANLKGDNKALLGEITGLKGKLEGIYGKLVWWVI